MRGGGASSLNGGDLRLGRGVVAVELFPDFCAELDKIIIYLGYNSSKLTSGSGL